MAASSKITLTIAGDSTGVVKALAQTNSAAQHTGSVVEKSSHQAGEALEGMGRQARSTREILRGLGDASMLVGGEEGQMATNAIYAASALKDLSRGTGELVKTLGLAKIATGGVILAIAALGAGVSAHIDHTNIMNEVNRTAADTSFYLSDALSTVTAKVPVLGGLFDKLRDKTDSWSQSAHGATDEAYNLADGIAAAAAAMAASGLGQGGFSDTDGLGTGMSILDPSNGSNASWMAGLQQAQDQIDANARRVTTHAAGSTSRSVGTVIDAAAQAAKDKLAKWQGIADDFSNIAKGISDDLGPKLVQGDQSSLRLFPGASMLDKLKKQLADTLHLKKDLAALAKGGLSNGLLEQLTAGGLDSIGAADELLAGGKSGIRAVNKTAGQITAAGGSIAGADAARQFADSLKKPIKVTLSVGKGGDDVLDKWLQKALKTNGAKFYGLKAA